MYNNSAIPLCDNNFMNTSSKSLLPLYLLYFSIILIWSVGWPITKVAFEYISPTWLAVFRLGFGSLLFLIIFSLSGSLKWPKKSDIPLILCVGLFQMGFFMLLCNLGLKLMETGKATIMVYTTPLWVAPIARIFFAVRISWEKILGLFLGIAGIVVLADPTRFDWHDHATVFGCLAILSSSVCWALGIIFNRYMKSESRPEELITWQFIVGTIPVLLFALVVEPRPYIIWNHFLIFTIAYHVILTTAFGYWAMILISKTLPVYTSSIGLLFIPLLSVMGAHLFLGEALTPQKNIAMVLISSGLLISMLFSQVKIFKRGRHYERPELLR